MTGNNHIEFSEGVQEPNRVRVGCSETKDKLVAIATDEHTRPRKSDAESLEDAQ